MFLSHLSVVEANDCHFYFASFVCSLVVAYTEVSQPHYIRSFPGVIGGGCYVSSNLALT